MYDDDDDLVGTVDAPPKPKRREKAPAVAETPAKRNSVSAEEELRALIERFERLEADKKAVASEQKDLMAEAKGRGYDTKAMRKIIAERKADAEELAQFNAVVELYREVLGMN
jgi:uncharacterized protein (UPF0335 family)